MLRKLLLEKREDNNPVPEGYCPKCWGREEYGGKFYSAIKKENVDIKTLSSDRHGWVLDYADKHFKSIELKYEGDMYVKNIMLNIANFSSNIYRN